MEPHNTALITEALQFIGQKELPGPDTNPVFKPWFDRWVPQGLSKDDSKTAWCSIFMNEIAWRLKLQHSNSLAAQSWLRVGEEVQDPQMGDVVIFWRGSPTSWKGHVGIYIREDENYIWTLGGNQANAVTISPYLKTRAKGYRRLRASYRT